MLHSTTEGTIEGLLCVKSLLNFKNIFNVLMHLNVFSALKGLGFGFLKHHISVVSKSIVYN